MARRIASALSTLLLGASLAHGNPASAPVSTAAVMQGLPPTAESQVTKANYLSAPYNRWSLHNASTALNVAMIPRDGDIWRFARDEDALAGYTTAQGEDVDAVFARNYADGLVVVQGDRIVHEGYYGEFEARDQHLWFSMTKSLVSAVFGLLEEAGRVDLDASPADYIPELKDSAFARVTIQEVLNHTTALAFKENYTDPSSDFARFYGPALGMTYVPGGADVQPGQTEVYGVHDFLVHFVKPDAQLQPGDAFDYNSANADVLGWLVARLTNQPLQTVIADHIWSQLGTEHDAYMVVDRAYMPVATGGFNATLRDSARFGVMVRDGGVFNGRRVLPEGWLDAMLAVDSKNVDNMRNNPVYATMPWHAYRNMWWLLDPEQGEFCAVGIHGQVIYINRAADTVMVWFSSQPDASSAASPHFLPKLEAARALAVHLNNKES